jgi:hypothetical protein
LTPVAERGLDRFPGGDLLGELALDADHLRASADAVLDAEPYMFPVRHHSPAVARALESALRARRPKLVLIEGPSEATDMIPFVIDGKTRPPIAIYSSYRDDQDRLRYRARAGRDDAPTMRVASWYPLLAYSPEYVALRTAAELGAESAFIDLPHYALIPPAPKGVDDGVDDGDHDDHDDSGAAPPAGEDQLFAESGFFQRLARAAGFRSWDEAWDALFEIQRPDRDVAAFRRELAYFCAAVRATTDPGRLASDGTLARERFMRRAIDREIAARRSTPAEVMVVCGGFHLFLDRADPTPPPEPPAGTVTTTVVPYSFFRVSELTGYAAGNRAPQFYQTLWEHDRGAAGREAAIRHIVDVLGRARKRGALVSSADAIAVTQTADLLAQLRGRPAPVLDDIRDALVTCCVKGDPAREGEHLLRAMGTADVGSRVGRVTPALGRLPILNDFYAQLDDLGLDELAGKEGRLVLDLDTREPRDAARAELLRRLSFLGVPIGGRDQPGELAVAGRLFRERWKLRWDPGIEPALIELALAGDTIAAAALSRLTEALGAEEQSADEAARHLVEAVELGFPDLFERAAQLCGPAIDNDGRFISQSAALSSLLVLDRQATFRKLPRDRIAALVERCFQRACFALPAAGSAPDEQHPAIVAGLLGLGEALNDRGAGAGGAALDRSLFVDSLRRAVGASSVPYLRGAFEGALTELQVQPADALAAQVTALARALPDQMITAGDYLDGVLSVSRASILMGADALLNALDGLLGVAGWEPFLVMLPRMRGAFERLHARQRDALAARVAVMYGLATAGDRPLALGTSVGAAVRIARIDAEVGEIMKGWDFS